MIVKRKYNTVIIQSTCFNEFEIKQIKMRETTKNYDYYCQLLGL
jgi:hypothetical protein